MSVGTPSLALKIDVDTLEGYLDGVPRMAETLGRLGLRATFCVAMGPDRSGLAVRRIFTKRGFLGKMLRTRAAATYGLRTMLYGTLLPSPLIAARRPALLRSLETAGHEVIPHGWDHINWHDHLRRWGLERTREQIGLACSAYEEHVGHPCRAFASPGWQWTERSAAAEEELGLSYAADTRGWAPFFPEVRGRPAKLLQLPTTLPTLDELIGRPDLRGGDLLAHLLDLCRRPAGREGEGSGGERAAADGEAPAQDRPLLHIWTAHAEVEGRGWAGLFADLLSTLKDEGFRFPTLAEVAEEALAAGDVPACAVADRELPGRAGAVACQVGFSPQI